MSSSTIKQNDSLQADKRQLGGLLMLSGATALIFPMANLATLVGNNGSSASSGLPLSSLIASVIVISMGLINIPVGFLQCVCDFQAPKLTLAWIVYGQLAWLPFLTDLSSVAKGAASGMAFIPAAYEPSEGDVKLVGSMGFLGIMGYGVGFLGTLSFLQFALYAFQKNQPDSRPGSYYKNRLTFYSFANLLVGISQFILGNFVLVRYGSGPLPNGPVSVAMYMINFPEISIAVGSLQILNAVYGLMRSCGFSLYPADRKEQDHSFMITTYIQWVSTVVLQILVQVAYLPAGTGAAAAPSQTMLTLGIHIIMTLLDYKMRTTPETFSDTNELEKSEEESGNSEEFEEMPANYHQRSGDVNV